MKKTLVLICLVLVFLGGLSAQQISKNDFIVDLGAGIGEPGIDYFHTPAWLLSAQYVAFSDVLFKGGSVGLGIQTGYFSFKVDGKSYNAGKFGLLVNYHYQLTPHLVLSAGLIPGFYTDDYHDANDDFSGYSGLFQEINVSARYYFTPAIGAFAGVSTGESRFLAGVSVKL